MRRVRDVVDSRRLLLSASKSVSAWAGGQRTCSLLRLQARRIKKVQYPKDGVITKNYPRGKREQYCE